MKALATTLLLASLAMPASADYIRARFYAAETPEYTVMVEESKPKQPCLGSGAYDQRVTIRLKNNPIYSIVVEDACANEKTLDEMDTIIIKRPKGDRDLSSEICNQCPEEQFAKELYTQATKIAWDQNKEQFVKDFLPYLKNQISIDKVKRTLEVTPDNVVTSEGVTRYSVRSRFVPKGDEIVFSYVETAQDKALLLYIFKFTKEGADVKIYYDLNADTTLDAVMDLKALPKLGSNLVDSLSLQKAMDEAKEKKTPPRTPSAKEKEFVEGYLQGLIMGRIQL